MFTSKGLFSDVVCPYQEKCLLPGCMFSHPKLAEPALAPTAIAISELEKEKTTPENQGQDAKSVKRRIEPEKTVTTKEANNLLKTALVPKERVFIGEPVSPPPLRRKILNGNAIPVTKQPPQKDAAAPISKVVQSPKKEGLNPRALKTKGWLFRLVCV